MPGVDLNAVYADPEFNALSAEEKQSVLTELGYGGLKGGAEASIGPGQAPSAWEKAREVIGNAIFGTPERAEAKAMGLGVDTTPAELIQGAALAAAPVAAPVLEGIPGAVGAAGRATLPYLPKAYGAVSGMRQGYRTGGIPGAVAGGVTGFMKPAGTGGVSGAIEGFEGGGIPGAVGGAVLGTVMGGGGDKVARLASALKGAPASTAAVRAEAAAAQAAAKSATAAPPAAAPAAPRLDPGEIQNYVMTMRQQHGLSGAQITDFLRSKYGIPLKDGSKMVKMILEAQ